MNIESCSSRQVIHTLFTTIKSNITWIWLDPIVQDLFFCCAFSYIAFPFEKCRNLKSDFFVDCRTSEDQIARWITHLVGAGRKIGVSAWICVVWESPVANPPPSVYSEESLERFRKRYSLLDVETLVFEGCFEVHVVLDEPEESDLITWTIWPGKLFWIQWPSMASTLLEYRAWKFEGQMYKDWRVNMKRKSGSSVIQATLPITERYKVGGIAGRTTSTIPFVFLDNQRCKRWQQARRA